jgi:hypothetical protein
MVAKAKTAPIEVTFSETLQAWFDNFSQSAAVDMGEGGDDAECVAEACCTVIDMPYVDNAVRDEYRGLVRHHGYHAVLREAAKHCRTL